MQFKTSYTYDMLLNRVMLGFNMQFDGSSADEFVLCHFNGFETRLSFKPVYEYHVHKSNNRQAIISKDFTRLTEVFTFFSNIF